MRAQACFSGSSPNSEKGFAFASSQARREAASRECEFGRKGPGGQPKLAPHTPAGSTATLNPQTKPSPAGFLESWRDLVPAASTNGELTPRYHLAALTARLTRNQEYLEVP